MLNFEVRPKRPLEYEVNCTLSWWKFKSPSDSFPSEVFLSAIFFICSSNSAMPFSSSFEAVFNFGMSTPPLPALSASASPSPPFLFAFFNLTANGLLSLSLLSSSPSFLPFWLVRSMFFFVKKEETN